VRGGIDFNKGIRTIKKRVKQNVKKELKLGPLSKVDLPYRETVIVVKLHPKILTPHY